VHEVQIEVLLLSVSKDDQLRWRVAHGNLPAGCRPDTRACEIAGLGTDVPPGTVVHSTSWRPTPDGLTLTYAILPDRSPAEGTVQAVPADAHVVCSAETSAPTPAIVTVEHVLGDDRPHELSLDVEHRALDQAAGVPARAYDANRYFPLARLAEGLHLPRRPHCFDHTCAVGHHRYQHHVRRTGGKGGGRIAEAGSINEHHVSVAAFDCARSTSSSC